VSLCGAGDAQKSGRLERGGTLQRPPVRSGRPHYGTDGVPGQWEEQPTGSVPEPCTYWNRRKRIQNNSSPKIPEKGPIPPRGFSVAWVVRAIKLAIWRSSKNGISETRRHRSQSVRAVPGMHDLRARDR